MEKLKISKTIVVEGKYDKIKVASVADAHIIALDGFGIFNNAEKQSLLRKLAESSGLIVITDSDPAGGFLRGKLRGMLPKSGVTNLYTPQIEGKERRKKTASKAGLLGVEGMSVEVVRELLTPFADGTQSPVRAEKPITKAMFYEAGLSGKNDSAARRDELAKRLGLPSGMSANALIEAMNILGIKLSE